MPLNPAIILGAQPATIPTLPQMAQQRLTLASLAQDAQLNAQKVRQNEQILSGQSALAQALSGTPMIDDPTGAKLYDVSAITQKLASQGFGAQADETAQHLLALNNAALSTANSRLGLIRQGAQSIQATGNDPTLASHWIDQQLRPQIGDKEADQWLQMIKSDPSIVGKLTAYYAGPPKTTALAPGSRLVNSVTGETVTSAPSRPVSVPAGGQLVNPDTGATVATGAPRLSAEKFMLNGKPVMGFVDPQNQRYLYQGRDVTDQAKPIPPASVQVLNQPVDPAQVSWVAGQVKHDFSLLGPLTKGNPGLQKAVVGQLAQEGVNVKNLTSTSRTMQQTAEEMLPQITRIEGELEALNQKGLMGVVGGHWRDLLAGKSGAAAAIAGTDPKTAQLIGRFQSDLKLLMTAAARAHGGARGGGSPMMLEHFESFLSSAGKDLPTFQGNLEGLRDWMQMYSTMGDATGGKDGDKSDGQGADPLGILGSSKPGGGQ